MFDKILGNVKNKVPLVHCITNYVTVNDVANIVLACGGSPVMADDDREAAQITSIADALYINIGTLNSRTVNSMLLAGECANKRGIPVVFDPVGAGASSLRTETAKKLIETLNISVIRGNISEIKTLAGISAATKGVDAAVSDTDDGALENDISVAKKLAQDTKAVVAISGEVDIITDGERVCLVKNGHIDMTKITGTGCMLTGVVAAYCGANKDDIFAAAVSAICAVGYCGEKAQIRMENENAGTSSLRMWMIDNIYRLTADDLKEGAKYELR